MTAMQVSDAVEVQELAELAGVCVRPVVRKLVDTESGEQRYVPIPCGSTRERVCPSCADKARKLRMQQCREGWHRTTESGIAVPDVTGLDLSTAKERSELSIVAEGRRYEPAVAAGVVLDQSPKPATRVRQDSEIGVIVSSDDPADEDQPDPDIDNENEEDDTGKRRRRSTRRRDDMDALPKKPNDGSTVGQAFTTPEGRTYRPSMFLTFTLPSYGRVREDGTPRDPNSYDYRRAALDALHFPKLIDRLWQNLRRCAGYNVQYFATVEPQKRLALHLHAAVRGTIPRSTVRQVVDATYHQVWWPPHDTPIYVHRFPVWDDTTAAYVDPDDGVALPTWDQALDALDDDEDAEPAHVVRFGQQFDYTGIVADTEQKVSKAIGYLTKYLTKSVAETYDPDTITARQREHRDRLHEEIRWLPCSPTCANWLRFGIQPKHAKPGMQPGECSKRAHELDNLGHGGRRVLVSRDWSGKRLTEHKADRAAIVKEVLTEAGIEMPDIDRYAADTSGDVGQPRYVWEPVDILAGDQIPGYRELVRAAIRERNRWRTQYDTAKQSLAARDGPSGSNSATDYPSGERSRQR